MSSLLCALALAAPTQAAVPGANGKLAITSSEPCGTCLVGVYTINPDGTGRTRLSPVTVGDLEPKWSPDGRRIAFSRGPYHDVWVMNADGGGAVNLTAASAANDFSPAWSPAGDKIAFVSCCADAGFAIYVMNADGSGRHRLTAPLPDAFDLDWSPRGDQIAFVGGSVGYQVYVADALTGEVTQITHGYNSYSPSWSPDGMKIVLAEDRESPDEPRQPLLLRRHRGHEPRRFGPDAKIIDTYFNGKYFHKDTTKKELAERLDEIGPWARFTLYTVLKKLRHVYVAAGDAAQHVLDVPGLLDADVSTSYSRTRTAAPDRDRAGSTDKRRQAVQLSRGRRR